jgi:hypothetical protein
VLEDMALRPHAPHASEYVPGWQGKQNWAAGCENVEGGQSLQVEPQLALRDPTQTAAPAGQAVQVGVLENVVKLVTST